MSRHEVAMTLWAMGATTGRGRDTLEWHNQLNCTLRLQVRRHWFWQHVGVDIDAGEDVRIAQGYADTINRRLNGVSVTSVAVHHRGPLGTSVEIGLEAWSAMGAEHIRFLSIFLSQFSNHFLADLVGWVGALRWAVHCQYTYASTGDFVQSADGFTEHDHCEGMQSQIGDTHRLWNIEGATQQGLECAVIEVFSAYLMYLEIVAAQQFYTRLENYDGGCTAHFRLMANAGIHSRTIRFIFSTAGSTSSMALADDLCINICRHNIGDAENDKPLLLFDERSLGQVDNTEIGFSCFLAGEINNLVACSLSLKTERVATAFRYWMDSLVDEVGYWALHLFPASVGRAAGAEWAAIGAEVVAGGDYRDDWVPPTEFTYTGGRFHWELSDHVPAQTYSMYCFGLGNKFRSSYGFVPAPHQTPVADTYNGERERQSMTTYPRPIKRRKKEPEMPKVELDKYLLKVGSPSQSQPTVLRFYEAMVEVPAEWEGFHDKAEQAFRESLNRVYRDYQNRNGGGMPKKRRELDLD